MASTLLARTLGSRQALHAASMPWFVNLSMALGIALSLGSSPAVALDLTGEVAARFRLFPHEGRHDEAMQESYSLASQLELRHDWDQQRQRFTIVAFSRWDPDDRSTSQVDLRDCYWQAQRGSFLLTLGVRTVFWGVTESHHLVDIINQSDLAEDLDGEDKLGQPMVSLAWLSSWGMWELYALPLFRERTFAEPQHRLSLPYPLHPSSPVYESADENHNIDLALRYSHSSGPWDFGASLFRGTSREPRIQSRSSIFQGTRLVLRYDQIDQLGIDSQLSLGRWLLKLEALHRRGQGEPFSAAIAGIETATFAVFKTRTDISFLLEYLYDTRGPNSATPFDDDLFVGFRLNMNDAGSATLQAGLTRDLETRASALDIEASRRFWRSVSLNLRIRAFTDFQRPDPLYWVQKDDYVELTLSWAF